MTRDPNARLRVLFLPRWYPNRYDPMPGLFISRQAEVLAEHCDVAVVYIHPDPQCPNKVEAEFSEERGVRVLRVYYRPPSSGSVLGKAAGLWKYYRAAMKAVRSIRQFSPDIIHAHILTRMGLIAMNAASEMKVPFIISEHWSRYFPENDTYHGWLRKMLTSRVVFRAAAITAVSLQLKEMMQSRGIDHEQFRIIPNVVDTTIFFPDSEKKKNPQPVFLHISCFDDKSKNISGFLRSLKAVSEVREDFLCLMVGEGPDWHDMRDYAQFLRIPSGVIRFTGVLENQALAEAIRKSDFTVLSSRYETFGTVIVESLACGIPVVSTRVGIAPELISEQNGILTGPGDEEEMSRAILQMLGSFGSYDNKSIAAAIEGRFDGRAIAGQMTDLYREVINSGS